MPPFGYDRRAAYFMQFTISDVDRLQKKVQIIDNGCWQWLGMKDPKGYGRVRRNKKLFQAHRVMYMATYGIDVAGKDLHHTCENKSCVNPRHLRPLTRKQHIAVTPASSAYSAVAFNKCIHGHPYTEANTIWEGGRRRCRQCKHDRWLEALKSSAKITSPYQGVYWNRMAKKWSSECGVDGQFIYLGLYIEEQEAAYVHDQVSLQLIEHPSLLNIL